jgi:hypothetical protein
LGIPLSNSLSEGETVIGFSTEGRLEEMKGYVMNNNPEGSTVIQVAYHINAIQANYVGCQVHLRKERKFDQWYIVRQPQGLKEFEAGQLKLMNGDCVGASKNKERIVLLMLIPLIQ